MDTPVTQCLHCNTPVVDIARLQLEPWKYPCRHILVPLEPGIMKQRYFCSDICFDCYDACDEEMTEENSDVDEEMVEENSEFDVMY